MVSNVCLHLSKEHRPFAFRNFSKFSWYFSRLSLAMSNQSGIQFGVCDKRTGLNAKQVFGQALYFGIITSL